MIRFSINKLVLLVVIQFFALSAHSQQNMYDDRIFYGELEGWSLGVSIGALLFDRLDFDVNGTTNVGDDTNSDSMQVSSATGYSDLTQTIPVPAITLVGEYRPYRGLSLGIEGSYFQQEHDGAIELCILADVNEGSDVFLCNDNDVFFDGKSRSILLLAGGNYFFGNRTVITPYLTADVGAGGTLLQLNSADQDATIVDDWGYHSVIQAGGGFDVDLGPVTLGAAYNYILLNEHNLYQNEQMSVTNESGGITNLDVTNRFTMRELGGHRVDLKLSVKPGTLRGAR